MGASEMEPEQQSDAEEAKPVLLFFGSATSGHSRRVEGFLAQVLQRRHNHSTFTLRRLDYETDLELAKQYEISEAPTLVVLEGAIVRARLEGPRGSAEIRTLLEPWLQ